MGSIVEYFRCGWKKVEPETVILFLGLDRSGKSTILKRCINLIPTRPLNEVAGNVQAGSDKGWDINVENIIAYVPTKG